MIRLANHGAWVVSWLLVAAALIAVALNPGPTYPVVALLWLGIVAVARGFALLVPRVALPIDLSLLVVCLFGFGIGGLILLPGVIGFAVADALPRAPAAAT